MPYNNWKNITECEIRYAFDHSVRKYNSFEEALRALGWENITDIKYGILSVWIDVPFIDYTRRWKMSCGDDYIIVDQYGLPIPVWKIKEKAIQLGLQYYKYSRYKKFKFRDGPVTGIHSGRRRWRSYHSWPKQTQEIRENHFLDHYDEDAKEYGIKSRVARNIKIDPWNEGWYRKCIKNWKNHRRTQWK